MAGEGRVVRDAAGRLRLDLVRVPLGHPHDPRLDQLQPGEELGELGSRPQFVVATKIDALDEPDRLERLRARAGHDGRGFFAISSVTGAGVDALSKALGGELDRLRENPAPESTRETREAMLVES